MSEGPSDARTTYDLKRGLHYDTISGPNVINPPKEFPALEGINRYRLSTRLLGHLERLAQTRFLIRNLTNEDFERWQAVDDQSRELKTKPRPMIIGLGVNSIIQPIAQSVYCSSAIEGEEIHRNSIEIAIVGQAHAAEDEEKHPKNRVRAIRDIYLGYVWALSRPFPLGGGADIVITPEFIKEVHHLMFESTKGEDAGRYKQNDNKIERKSDGLILAHMLPHEKVELFMEVLCDRINSQFIESDRHGSVSKLLSIAEFVSDFLAIHPFKDGNGRMARLLSTYLLERAGYHFARFYALDAVILERHAEYYDALLTAQRNFYMPQEDMTPWIEYYIDCVFMQWLRAHQYIKGSPTNGIAPRAAN